MSKKINTLEQKILHEEEYIKFLLKKLNSENFKKNVSKEEYANEKKKYEKAKFKLRVLKNE